MAHTDSGAAGNSHAQAIGGLAGATARGEAARVQGVKDGLVVSGAELAQAWGLTRQALAPAADRGESRQMNQGFAYAIFERSGLRKLRADKLNPEQVDDLCDRFNVTAV